MIDVNIWKQLILQFFIDRSPYSVCRVTRKEEIFESFGNHLDANADVALIVLINGGLILRCTSNGDDFYTIDIFDRKEDIQKIVKGEELDTQTEMMQPDESETENLEPRFVTKSVRPYPNQSTYYYYTKKDDDKFWVALLKTKPNSKATKIILGSLQNPDSRLYRIWHATKLVNEESVNEHGFKRKEVEDKDQKACGNNRLPSKAAFDIFLHKKWLFAEKIGRTTYYKVRKITHEKEPEPTEDEYQTNKNFTDDKKSQ